MEQGDVVKVKVAGKVIKAIFLSEQDDVIFCTVDGYAPLAVAKEDVVTKEYNDE